ncbi:MAG: Adenosyl-chloride synthase [Myxococcota bacterium]|nr:Adenosyl-chloride synthase [Myxococcota bacterium]
MMRGLVTLLTDFGAADSYVAEMKGVMLGLDPTIRFVDITHSLAGQDVMAGAWVLSHAVWAFPEGCVHLAVVDPGVGTQRKPVAIECDGHYFVGPDNGLLFPAVEGRAWKAVELNRADIHRHPVSSTFHGRDIFSPAAARLAMGQGLDAVGSPLQKIAEITFPRVKNEQGNLTGIVIKADHFGNLITNITPADLGLTDLSMLSVSIGNVVLKKGSRAYGEMTAGEALFLWGSHGRLEIAVNRGSAAARFGYKPGVRMIVKILFGAT